MTALCARLLVVDGEPEFRVRLRAALSSVGFSVATAGDGREAAEVADSFGPDLVIVDAALPQADRLVRRLRRGWPPAAVLFLTAEAGAAAVTAALPGTDRITRPFRLIELVSRVRALLDRDPGRRPRRAR